MSFRLELYSQEPTVAILELEGSITAEEITQHFDAIEDMLREVGLENDNLYLLIDARRVSMDFPNVIEGSKLHGVPRRGAAADPLTRGVFVSQDQMIQLLRDLLAKHTAEAYLPIFEDRDKAFEYIKELAAVEHKQAQRKRRDN